MVRLKVERLLWEMDRSNRNQLEFADLLGMTAVTLRLYLKGIRNPQAQSRRKMLRALKLTFDDLFEIVNNNQKGVSR
jgi:transcriptional regulator with XRE-family HTH domain